MDVRALALACCTLFIASSGAALANAPAARVVRVDITPAHRVQTIRPLESLGSTVYKEPAGSIPRLHSRQNFGEKLDAGWGWLSYRLFTELSDQDWHWNPAGAFSAGDPRGCITNVVGRAQLGKCCRPM